MAQIYTNTEIFDGKKLIKNHSLVTSDGKVVDIIANSNLPYEAHITKLNHGILSPGYVEVQANGGGGVLFNDEPTIQGLQTILKAHRKFGTIAILPTFITDTPNKMALGLKAIEDGLSQNLQGLIGGHFEGPFLNIEKKGTHLPEYIRKPNKADLELLSSYNLGHSLVTLAPENVEPAFIEALVKSGFKVAAGHTMAQKEDMLKAHKAGLSGVTHLYNAMPPLMGRQPAVIGSSLALGLYNGIIVDGIHSDAYCLQFAYKAFGAERLMLVTDSMHTIGIEGISEFMITGQKVFVKGDRLVNENGSLAGAHITMEQSVKNAHKLMKASVEDSLKMAITTPAQFINIPYLSKIKGRNLNDILWLDNELNVSFLNSHSLEK
ncbi:MAG: N-acetylglucosamine-6-phosphate deacetylase [Alphaproteobacteria bacterium]